MDWLNLCNIASGTDFLNCPGGVTQFVGTLIVWLVIALGAWLAAWLAWRLLRVVFWPTPKDGGDRRQQLMSDLNTMFAQRNIDAYEDGPAFIEWLDCHIKRTVPNDAMVLRGQKFWTRDELEELVANHLLRNNFKTGDVPTPAQVDERVRGEVKHLLLKQGLLREVPGNKVHFNVTEQHGSVRTDRPWATAQDAPARTPDVNSFG